MHRLHWIPLLLLSAAGCVPGEAWQFEPREPKSVKADAKREVRKAQARSEQPAPQLLLFAEKWLILCHSAGRNVRRSVDAKDYHRNINIGYAAVL